MYGTDKFMCNRLEIYTVCSMHTIYLFSWQCFTFIMFVCTVCKMISCDLKVENNLSFSNSDQWN